MSREAQAGRERRARVILSTAETGIAEKFGQASLGLGGLLGTASLGGAKVQ